MAGYRSCPLLRSGWPPGPGPDMLPKPFHRMKEAMAGPDSDSVPRPDSGYDFSADRSHLARFGLPAACELRELAETSARPESALWGVEGVPGGVD